MVPAANDAGTYEVGATVVIQQLTIRVYKGDKTDTKTDQGKAGDRGAAHMHLMRIQFNIGVNCGFTGAAAACHAPHSPAVA